MEHNERNTKQEVIKLIDIIYFTWSWYLAALIMAIGVILVTIIDIGNSGYGVADAIPYNLVTIWFGSLGFVPTVIIGGVTYIVVVMSDLVIMLSVKYTKYSSLLIYFLYFLALYPAQCLFVYIYKIAKIIL